MSPIKIKSFFTFNDKFPKMVQGLFTSISVVAAMPPIVERPNAILKSEFVNIYAFHISQKKR